MSDPERVRLAEYGGRVPRELRPADYPGCPVTVQDAVAVGRVLRAPRWGLWDVAGAVVAAAVLSLGVAVVLVLVDPPIAVQVLVGVVTPWVALAGWPILATRLRGNGARLDLGLRLNWRDTGWGLLGGFVAFALAAISAAITQAIVPDLNSAAAEAAEELRDSGRLAITLFALIVMIGAPVVEELYFRGFLFSALRKRGLSALLTIVVTAILFAGFHVEPVRFLILLPTGLVLGWVRWKTGSTGAAMVAHGCVNTPGALLLLFDVDVTAPG